jgi:hypothetical protein
VFDSPLRDQPWTDRRAAVERRAAEPAVITEVLRPGDCLYLPRGFLHAAEALGGISTHLTIGVHVWTRYAIAERLVGEAVRALAGDAESRRSLPLGVDFVDGAIDDEMAAVRRALLTAIQAVDPATTLASLRQASRATSRAAPIGPLAQFRTAERLDAGWSVSLRPHLAATIEPLTDGRAVLRSRADDLVLEASEVSGVDSLLMRRTVSAGELGVGLARRLVLAGLAVSDAPRE